MAERRIRVWVQAFQDRKALVLQWQDPATGKRKSKSAGTDNPREAEIKRADLEADLNAGRHANHQKVAWATFRERFEAEYVAPLRPCTRANYEDTLDSFEELCKPKWLDQVTVRTVSAFAAEMRTHAQRGKKGLAPSTIKVRLQFLRTALGWAVNQELLARCPRFPRVMVPEKKPQPVPVEAFERLFERAPDDQTRAYLLTGWLAGLRLSEAYLLEWEPADKAPYLDLARNRVVLPAEFAKGKSDQWVPLAPELRQALEALPRVGRRVFRFVDKRDGHVISASTMSDRVTRLAHKVGVRLTMHTLRKGFGCRYAGRVPAQVLQKLMRHRNIKTTMDYYANVDEAVEQAVLGEQRNSSRNSAGADQKAGQEAGNTNPWSDDPCSRSSPSR